MKTFDPDTLERLDAGEVDIIDAITFVFDGGVLNFFIGKGQFAWEDGVLGAQTFYGTGPLLTIEVPRQETGATAAPVTIRLAETYMPAGETVPVNVFDDGVRATIDEEPWQWREVILSVFWLAKNGVVLFREQVARRLIDQMSVEYDEAGRPFRVAVLERPDIVQKDIEGLTDNAELQQLIDATDLGLEHLGTTAVQKIRLGAMPEQAVA